MYNNGIIICLKNSKNLYTIKTRTKKLIYNLHIQIELPDLISPTIGCFNAHIKALKSAINLMSNYKNINYVIIGEEDIIIDYNSIYYKNLILCLNEYNKKSNYILHLGGIPQLTNCLFDIIKNINCKIKLKSNIYLTTGYVVNLNIAKKLLKVLNNSSNHIHCDAIFANSKINQYLVKGNIVNQKKTFKSKNTYINNIISTKIQAEFFLKLNKFSIFFISNKFIFITFYLISIYKHNYLISIIELFLLLRKFILKFIINKKYNKYLPSEIFLFLEFFLLLRIITFIQLLET